MRSHIPAFLILSAVLGGSPPVGATTFTVFPDGSGTAPTIQAGVTMCVAGDTVAVAAGTYYEHGIVMKDGVRVAALAGDPALTVVDAQGLDRVFYFSGIDSAASLAGFTITGGRAGSGGGILCKSASYPTIENCVIYGNAATEGAGIFCFHASPIIRDCVIRDNTAYAWGGGLSCYDNSLPDVTNTRIHANTAGEYGGGVWAYFYSGPKFFDCSIAGNSAGTSGGGVQGISSNVMLTDCVVTGNRAGVRGGAFAFSDCLPSVTGCTISGNRAGFDAGGAFHCETSKVTLTRSIVWGNGAPSGAEVCLADAASKLTILCSNVDTTQASWATGATVPTWSGSNLSVNPLFCGPEDEAAAPTEDGNYELHSASPMLNAGLGCEGTIGALGMGVGCLASTDVPRVATASVAAMSYPNPFRTQTTIAFELPTAAAVDLAVYNAGGRLVRTLASGTTHSEGRVQMAWDGRDDSGAPVAAGVYFARVRAGAARATHRVVRLQ